MGKAGEVWGRRKSGKEHVGWQRKSFMCGDLTIIVMRLTGTVL